MTYKSDDSHTEIFKKLQQHETLTLSRSGNMCESTIAPTQPQVASTSAATKLRPCR